jgi:hypothetical protein
MRVAFLAASAPGHGYPMITLARRLRGRGQDVVSIGSLTPSRSFELSFVPFSAKEYPAGSGREKLNQLSRRASPDPGTWPSHPPAFGRSSRSKLGVWDHRSPKMDIKVVAMAGCATLGGESGALGCLNAPKFLVRYRSARDSDRET